MRHCQCEAQNPAGTCTLRSGQELHACHATHRGPRPAATRAGHKLQYAPARPPLPPSPSRAQAARTPTRWRRQLCAQRGQHKIAVQQRQAAQTLSHHCAAVGQAGSPRWGYVRLQRHGPLARRAVVLSAAQSRALAGGLLNSTPDPAPQTRPLSCCAARPRSAAPQAGHPPARHSSSLPPAAPSSSCSTSACWPSLIAAAAPLCSAPSAMVVITSFNAWRGGSRVRREGRRVGGWCCAAKGCCGGVPAACGAAPGSRQRVRPPREAPSP